MNWAASRLATRRMLGVVVQNGRLLIGRRRVGQEGTKKRKEGFPFWEGGPQGFYHADCLFWGWEWGLMERDHVTGYLTGA